MKWVDVVRMRIVIVIVDIEDKKYKTNPANKAKPVHFSTITFFVTQQEKKSVLVTLIGKHTLHLQTKTKQCYKSLADVLSHFYICFAFLAILRFTFQ
jgi:hypothetical protein